MIIVILQKKGFAELQRAKSLINQWFAGVAGLFARVFFGVRKIFAVKNRINRTMTAILFFIEGL